MQTSQLARARIALLAAEHLLCPGDLHWFMNLSLTRSHINNYPRDRASRVIAPALLAGLKVVVPSINRQEKILQIAQLDLQARALEARIAEIRWLETETTLFQYAQCVLHLPPVLR